MRDAVFTLCPLTTIHDPCIYQALTHGSIPIAVVTSSLMRDLKELLGDLPFPVLPLQKGLPELLLQISEISMEEATLMQQNLLQWWPWKISTWQYAILQHWFQTK